MSGSGSGGGKGTTFPCDISDLCADQVAGQRLPQLPTTFVQIFVLYGFLTIMDS